MSEIAVYKEENQSLSEIAFVKNITSQVKIREADGYELNKAFSHFLVEITNRLGIKDAVNSYDKSDMLELILTKYKNLSFDEVKYAFKMERFGNLGERIEHYQLFNAEFVSKVLDKYVEWKRKIKQEHNISELKKPQTATEREKQYWINRGVTECIDFYEENTSLMDGKLYVYDVFYDLGYLPTDVEYKNKIKKDAIEVIEFEQSSKKPTTLNERTQIAEILADIQKPKSGILIGKCKELVLLEYFRKIFKNPEELEKIKNQFKNDN